MTKSPIATYLNWIQENGGTYKKIEFRNGCVYTTDTVDEDENFASVPFKLCITEHVARKSLPTLADFSGRMVLSLFLLLEKRLGKESFYWPYINILPKTIKTPLLFDQSELEYIKGTNLESATRDRKDNLLKDFERLLNSLPEGISKEDIQWQDFLWCYSVYSSRSFPYTLIDPSSTETSEVLFPLVDALNHKPNTKITWSRNGDIENGSLSFIAGQVFENGVEIFNNYGPKSNEELLLGYGFCFEYNENDHISLKPNFTQDPNFELKLHILKQCNIESGNIDPLTFYIHRNHIPDAFFRLMRVLVMNDTETECYMECTDGKLLDFVGYRNELSMIGMTLTFLKIRLQTLKAVNLNEDNHIADCKKFALMYRRGQHDIFNKTVAKVEAMKRNVIQRMYQDQKEGLIAPVAPFLSILNPSHQPSSIEIDTSNFVTLDQVVITTKKIMNKDLYFSECIYANFKDLEDFADLIMMTGLILENNVPDSEWRLFFDKVSEAFSNSDEAIEEADPEVKEMYDSLVRGVLVDGYPEKFSADVFTLKAYVWADYILNTYTINEPFAIVPL